MLRACAEARRYLGTTVPNPPVGATALNAAGEIIAVAAHQKAGEEHAEAALLCLCREQGILDQVHTLAVTLEPCNHFGRTPPCTAAIAATGIKNIAIGASDPNPIASGGAAWLRERGIHVVTGIAEAACRQLIAAFATSVLYKRPWITVKRAFDAHGSMIPPPGQKTFTSPASLRLAHRLRKKADAIVTGSGTILADRPLFTVRHVADHPDKTRILAIADRRRRVDAGYIDAATARGFRVMIFDDIEQMFEKLYADGAQDILVEAGLELSQAVLDRGLWNLGVGIHQGTEDRVEAALNEKLEVPFDRNEFVLDNMLPD
ncbi:MAG: bifunctional diaminohydroxyphosphoribosylaminopyrimidine deaminase/5-amino-6-(5-phosphoribosylamino)uracil reductase RibD [Alphaproteobacteria bacterium]